MAIARYDGDSGFYLFYCDNDWRVVTDTCHKTLELARGQAELEYCGVSSHWHAIDHEPAEESPTAGPGR